MAEQRDWSNLPPDIVAAIGDAMLAQGLLPCYISLRRVCTTWRHVTENPVISSHRFRPHNWILIKEHVHLFEPNCAISASLPPSNPQQTLCRFLNCLTGECVLVDIPQLRGCCVRACVDGLLLVSKVGTDQTKIADTDAPTRLLNPFTGASTDYPALSKLFCEQRMLRQWLPGLLSIGFASSTSSNLMVVTRNEVAYAAPGSRQWKLVANHYPRDAINVAHGFFRGCAYVLSVKRNLHCVELRLTQFKVDETRPDQVQLGVERLMTANGDLAKHIGWDIVSLIESDGELLLLSRSSESMSSDFFLVFKVVFDEGASGSAKADLVPLNYIGKHALLINKVYGSISVSMDVYPPYKPSSIYCYLDWSLAIYHRGVPRAESFYAHSSSTNYRYRLFKKSKFTQNVSSVFPDFGSRRGKRPRTGR